MYRITYQLIVYKLLVVVLIYMFKNKIDKYLIMAGFSKGQGTLRIE